MNKYKKWNIPLAVGAHYDGHMAHYAIPENPAYIALGDLPDPGSIEVIERRALNEVVYFLEECTKRLRRDYTGFVLAEKIDTFLSQIKDEGE